MSLNLFHVFSNQKLIVVPIETLEPLLSVKEAAPPVPADNGTSAFASPKEISE